MFHVKCIRLLSTLPDNIQLKERVKQIFTKHAIVSSFTLCDQFSFLSHKLQNGKYFIVLMECLTYGCIWTVYEVEFFNIFYQHLIEEGEGHQNNMAMAQRFLGPQKIFKFILDILALDSKPKKVMKKILDFFSIKGTQK